MSDSANLRWDAELLKDPLANLQNVQAEHALLGAIMIENRAFEHVADTVSHADFSYPVHGRIFRAIETLIGEGRPANPITLKNFFDADAALEGVGGHEYLANLVASAVTIVNCRSYAQTIADLARRRELVVAAQDMIADAAAVDAARPVDVVIDEAEERLFGLTDRRTGPAGPSRLGDSVSDTLGKIEEAYKSGGAIAVDTGLIDLDRIIAGMGAGDLCVLAARPSMGKSCLAGTVAANAAGQGKRVLFFTMEMSKQELSQRWLAALTGISTDRQRQGDLRGGDWQALIDAAQELNRLPIELDDQARLSVPQMRQRARRVRRRRGLDMIVIDHLQLIRQGGKQESRRLEIGDATSMLKAVAKELQVPILLLSQLSRAPEQRDDKRPVLSDLRESGDIEADADIVMLLYRDEYYLQRSEPKRKQNESRDAYAARLTDWQYDLESLKGVAEINVAKNRHGRTGVAKAFFDGERQRFDNLAGARQ